MGGSNTCQITSEPQRMTVFRDHQVLIHPSQHTMHTMGSTECICPRENMVVDVDHVVGKGRGVTWSPAPRGVTTFEVLAIAVICASLVWGVWGD